MGLDLDCEHELERAHAHSHLRNVAAAVRSHNLWWITHIGTAGRYVRNREQHQHRAGCVGVGVRVWAWDVGVLCVFVGFVKAPQVKL